MQNVPKAGGRRLAYHLCNYCSSKSEHKRSSISDTSLNCILASLLQYVSLQPLMSYGPADGVEAAALILYLIPLTSPPSQVVVISSCFAVLVRSDSLRHCWMNKMITSSALLPAGLWGMISDYIIYHRKYWLEKAFLLQFANSAFLK